MREIISARKLAPILNLDRGAIADQAKALIQSTLDSYDSGMNIVRVNLDKADPPREVIDAFRAVQAAEQKRDRLEREADAYAAQVLAGRLGVCRPVGSPIVTVGASDIPPEGTCCRSVGRMSCSRIWRCASRGDISVAHNTGRVRSIVPPESPIRRFLTVVTIHIHTGIQGPVVGGICIIPRIPDTLGKTIW